MKDINNSAVDAIVSSVLSAIENKLSKLKFDKTVVGVVTDVSTTQTQYGEIYKVTVMMQGKSYVIKTDKNVSEDDKVNILIANNDYKRLILLGKCF